MVRTMRARLSCGGPLASRRLSVVEPPAARPVRVVRVPGKQGPFVRHRAHPECDYCNHKYDYPPSEPVVNPDYKLTHRPVPLPGAVGGPSVVPGGICFCYGCSALHYDGDPLCVGDKEARQARIVEYLASLQ